MLLLVKASPGLGLLQGAGPHTSAPTPWVRVPHPTLPPPTSAPPAPQAAQRGWRVAVLHLPRGVGPLAAPAVTRLAAVAVVVSDWVGNQPHLPHVLLVSKPQCAVHLPASCAAADLAHNTALVADLQPQGACVSHRSWATQHRCFCDSCLCAALNLPLRLIGVCVLYAGVL